MKVLKILTRIFGSILAFVVLLTSILVGLSGTGLGLSVFVFFDFISFLIVVVVPYFLIAASSGSVIFFIQRKYMKAFGDLVLGFGFIGFVIGLILILLQLGYPTDPGIDPYAKLGKGLAVAFIPILYGLMMKYFIVFPIYKAMPNNE